PLVELAQVVEAHDPAIRRRNGEVAFLTRRRPQRGPVGVDEPAEYLRRGGLGAAHLAVQAQHRVRAGGAHCRQEPGHDQAPASVPGVPLAAVDDPPRVVAAPAPPRLRQREQPLGADEPHGWVRYPLPAGGGDPDGPPGGVPQVEVDVAAVSRQPAVYHYFLALEPRLALQDVDGGLEGLAAGGGLFLVPAEPGEELAGRPSPQEPRLAGRLPPGGGCGALRVLCSV